MPDWTYSISIVNNSDRTLELVSSSISFGKKSKEFPEKIEPGQSGVFSVYSPAEKPTGIEFYFSLRDVVPNKNDTPYGLINFSLNMPYWRPGVSNALSCTGLFKQDGFVKIPDGTHNFATCATVFSTAAQSDGSSEKTEYHGIYEWDNLKKLAILDPGDTKIEDLIPDSYILFDRKTQMRTNTLDIPKNMWDQINDKSYPDSFAKEKYVKNYFVVSAVEVRKINTLTIPAKQEYKNTVEVKSDSMVKKEVSENLLLENALNFNVTDGIASLSYVIKQAFGIEDLRAYSSATDEAANEELAFDAADFNRNVVIWEVVKVVAIFRETLGNKTELVGIGDYPVTAVPKVYNEKT